MALSLIIALSACSFFGPKYKEGVYEGEAYGYSKSKKPIKLSVAIDSEGKIRDIVILDHEETDKIGGEALKTLVDQVLNSQMSIKDLEIDNVSKATETSNGFKEALKNALEKAKKS